MHMRSFWVCILLLANSLLAHGQWEAIIKSIADPEGPNNTSFFLQYQMVKETPQTYHVEISFRLPGSHRTVAAKELYISAQSPKLFTFPFFIPYGKYEVDVDIVNTQGEDSFTKQMIYQSRYLPGQLSISDIFLAKRPSDNFNNLAPLLQPIPIFSSGENAIFFYVEVYDRRSTQISVDATLLSQQPQEQPQVIHYVSLQNSSKVLPLENGKAIFSGSFEIATLPRGQYNILIRATGGQTVDNTINFIVKDKIQARIKQNLDANLSMMKYILSEEKVEALKNLDASQKWDSLQAVWTNISPGTDESPFYTENAMEAYYRKLFVFQDSLAYPGEDWTSDRAKIFLFYGVPDKGWEELRTFEHNGKWYEQWTYSADNLIFTFQKRNNSYFLIE